MKVELLKAWNGFSPGRVIEPSMNQVATDLIKRGLAKLVEEPGEKPEKKRPKLQEWVKQDKEV